MSHISNAIEALLVKNNMSAAGLSRVSGINEAQISRLRTGEQICVNPNDLVRIARGCYPTANADFIAEVHAQLLCAHLQDERVGPGAKYISIVVTPGASTVGSCEAAQAPRPVLPPRDQQNIDVITSHITKSHLVRDLVQSVANFCRRIRCSKAHAGQHS